MNIASIPKVELHCHLDGILDPPMLSCIRDEHPFFPIALDSFKTAYPITCYSDFVNWWSLVAPIEGSLSHFYPILSHHIARLRAQHVSYSEILIGSSEVPIDTNQAIEDFKALRRWVTLCENGDIQLEFIVAFGRDKSPQEVSNIADRILALHNAGLIVGVALAGPERNHPVRPFTRTFARFREAGLNIEIHAGEWCGPESIWDALEYGYPNRIGHGVCIFQDQRLPAVIQERRIHLELCLTSNIRTQSIRRVEDHPVREVARHGLSFSINTDDPGVFQCSMNSEYALLQSAFCFTEDDFRMLYGHSLAARFQPTLRVNAAYSRTA